MWDAGTVDDVTWGALALALTVAGGLWTWWAFRHRGAVPGVRGFALTLLPAAAWLTGTLELLGDVSSAVLRWSSRLVFSPSVWLGVALAGLSALLLVVTGIIGARRSRRGVPAGAEPRQVPGPKGSRRGRTGGQAGAASSEDDEFADIEAMLRRRGIE